MMTMKCALKLIGNFLHCNRSFIALLCLLIITSVPCLGKTTILLVGDSLSAAFQIPPEKSWVSLLEKKLQKSATDTTLINSSIVGDTTGGGLARLPKLLAQYQPNIVILELGGNDGLQGLPTTTIKNNLSKMIELCLAAKAKVLLIGIKIPPNYGENYTKQFEQNFLELSKSYQIPLVPFLLDKVALRITMMLPDRIHPNVQAQPLILDNVWPYLEPILTP